MNYKACLIAAMFLASWAARASGEGITPTPSDTISLGEVLALAERDNPEIRAVKKRWDAMRQRTAQAATPEKPRIDIERMYAPSGRSITGAADEKALSVTQEIPFPTSLITTWCDRGG